MFIVKGGRDTMRNEGDFKSICSFSQLPDLDPPGVEEGEGWRDGWMDGWTDGWRDGMGDGRG